MGKNTTEPISNLESARIDLRLRMTWLSKGFWLWFIGLLASVCKIEDQSKAQKPQWVEKER